MRLIFWILFALMLGVYLTMILWSGPVVIRDAEGLLLFDLRPMGYSEQDAHRFLTALSNDGRLFYLNVQQMLDSAYPALMGVVLVMAFTHLFRRYYRIIAIIFAIAGMAFDYLENAAVAVMLHSGADGLTADMVATASRWTQLKSGAVMLALLALLIGLGMAWMHKRKARR